MDVENEYQEIRKKSFRGIKWVGIAEIFIRAFQFVTTVVLARILLPEDFGIIGVALIFTQLGYVLFDFGISSALIQKKDVKPIHYSSSFILYLILSIFFIILVLLFSGPISRYFHRTILQSILNLLSLICLFYGLNAIPTVTLMKALRFKKLSAFQTCGVFAYGAVSIVFAWQGAGVWAFVYGILAEQFTMTVLLFISLSWRISFRFSWQALKELLTFGSNVLGTRLVGYINSNSAYFIIGRVLGATQLGYYSLAYQFVEFPVQRISKNVLKVMFPAFSKIQDDLANYRDLYKQTIYYLSLVTLPIFVGIILIAPEFVRIFYGDKWIPAILPLQVLAAVGFLRSMWITTSIIFLSKGFPNTELRINVTFLVFLIPTLYFSTRFGIVGVAISLASILLIFYAIAVFAALKIIKLPFLEILKSFQIPVIGVCVFTLFVTLFKLFLENLFPSFLNFAIILTISIVIYSLILLKYDRDIFKKLKQLIGA